MKNFWKKINKPVYVLAPMAGVADSAFRQICKSFGADVVYSEMVSATAVAYNSKKTLELMKFNKSERPFVVQLFGCKPDHFAYAARHITKKIKPDGIDINFGCPVKKVIKQGAGAILMDNLKLARQVIKATIDNTNLPVSVKLRSRAGKTSAVEFLKYMSDLDIKAAIIHGRTIKQGNSGEVDWQIIKQARKHFKGIILANGGVKDKAGADELLGLTGADGIAIGQAALGKPWLFQEVRNKNLEVRSKSEEEIFKIMLKHAELAYKLKGKPGIIEMRKHLCRYVSGMPNSSGLRKELIKAESLEDIKLSSRHNFLPFPPVSPELQQGERRRESGS